MRVAVLSLCRDRLPYTKHCFETLRANAGCPYQHFVLDQASEDGTTKWLQMEFENATSHVVLADENLGISRGLNWLLDTLNGEFDVIVKVDNDCELLTPNTLRDIAQLTLASGWILGPVMHGYGTPLVETGLVEFEGQTFAEKVQIQGCFLAATGEFYKGFRYSESNPVWGGDDNEVCSFIRWRGGHCGQVLGYEANHYETTLGQEARYPEYFARKVREGMPWT